MTARSDATLAGIALVLLAYATGSRAEVAGTPTDPGQDDWRVEHFDSLAQGQLQRLAEWVQAFDGGKAPALPSIFTDDARSSVLLVEGEDSLHGSTLDIAR